MYLYGFVGLTVGRTVTERYTEKVVDKFSRIFWQQHALKQETID